MSLIKREDPEIRRFIGGRLNAFAGRKPKDFMSETFGKMAHYRAHKSEFLVKPKANMPVGY